MLSLFGLYFTAQRSLKPKQALLKYLMYNPPAIWVGQSVSQSISQSASLEPTHTFFNFAFFCFTSQRIRTCHVVFWSVYFVEAIKEMIRCQKYIEIQLSWWGSQASSKIFLVAPIIFLCLSRRASLEVNWKKRDMLDPALFTKLNISDSNNIVHLLWDVLQKSILGSQLQNEI